MIISRGPLICRALNLFAKRTTQKTTTQFQFQRNSSGSWSYRVGTPTHPRSILWGAEVIGGFMWWWILWHLWHDYEHITGEFPYPDPSSWTDKELGIPPDDYVE